MQFKAIVLSGVFGLAAAQSSGVASLVAEIPPCSLTCLLAGANAADCEAMDYTCQCSKQDIISANATSCLASSCNTNDIAKTQTVSQEICTIVSGNSSGSGSGSGSSSNSSSSSGSSSTATTPNTPSSDSASSAGTTGSSAASRPGLHALGLAAIAGVVGLMVM